MLEEESGAWYNDTNDKRKTNEMWCYRMYYKDKLDYQCSEECDGHEIHAFIERNQAELLATLAELCAIPAPSHHEEKRAEYCKNWLERNGAEGVYIDKALNVVFPLGCDGCDDITAFVAHTDTVFPDTEPMPYEDDGRLIHCPGAADDTASVAVLLMMAKFFIQNGGKRMLFVCNSCEEGLGNLKGTRALFDMYADRIARFISFDSNLDTVNDHCVGSHRYEVTVKTRGGHSFEAFGNANAIAELSKIVTEIYKLQIPQKEGTVTTYNVGTISGGTSVNTIAQSAKMLCEYRSNDKACLAIMEAEFDRIFRNAANSEVQVIAEKVGDRPCGDISAEKIDALKKLVMPVIENVIGKPVFLTGGSTDCNIPLSLGIPALCVGVNRHAGIHTRQEWVEKASLAPGLEIAIRLGLTLTQIEEG